MKINNKHAKFNFALDGNIEAGISLTGAEVKSVRANAVNLTSAHAKIINGELYLVGAIFSGKYMQEADATRSRKLLLHRREILSLITKMKQGKLTLVPVSFYTKGPRIKVGLALGKSKREFEKREVRKKRDIDRELKSRYQ